jgi:hypothetical protein
MYTIDQITKCLPQEYHKYFQQVHTAYLTYRQALEHLDDQNEQFQQAKVRLCNLTQNFFNAIEQDQIEEAQKQIEQTGSISIKLLKELQLWQIEVLQAEGE